MTLLELERTPGAVAVSETDGERPAGVVNALAGVSQTNSFTPLSPLSQPLPTCSQPSPEANGAYVHNWTYNREVLNVTRLIGYGKLKSLLQPRHPYFEDKWAEVKYWMRYQDGEGNSLCYPRVKTFHRENPYRRYQLNRQCSARSAKKLIKVIDENGLQGARVTDIVTTCPASVSAYLAGRGKLGRDVAWGLNRRFWSDMMESGLIGAGHARRSNLHTWSSAKPLEAHFHFHELIPNYEQVGSAPMGIDVRYYPGCECSICGEALWAKMGPAKYQCATCFPPGESEKVVVEFKRREWCRQSGGTMVPWSPGEMSAIKALWLNVLINIVRQKCIEDAWPNQAKLLRFQRRRGVAGLKRLVSFLSRLDKGLVDIYVSFVKLNSDIGRAKFVHKLSYNGRHPVEDYAVFSNNHSSCAEPPAWLLPYDNKARLRGWWRDLGKMVVLSEVEERVKLSPYDNKPLEYDGKYSVSEVIEYSEGKLVAVDFIRGAPVERLLGGDDISWLQSVDLHRWGYVF